MKCSHLCFVFVSIPAGGCSLISSQSVVCPEALCPCWPGFGLLTIMALENQKELWESGSCESHWVYISCPFGSRMEHHDEQLYLLIFLDWFRRLSHSIQLQHASPLQKLPIPTITQVTKNSREIGYISIHFLAGLFFTCVFKAMLFVFGLFNGTEITCFRLLMALSVGLDLAFSLLMAQ